MHTIHLLSMAHMNSFLLADGNDEFGISTFLNSFIALLTGPVAKFMAIVAIIAGATAFIGGREGHEGLKTLGMVGICVGLLAMMPSIWDKFHHGTTGLGF